MPFKDAKRAREHQSRYGKAWYDKNRASRIQQITDRKSALNEWVKSLKLACAICGEDHPSCLDFHHKDGSEKSFVVSRTGMANGYSKERILLEIEKCECLCSNCHRKLHWKQRQKLVA